MRTDKFLPNQQAPLVAAKTLNADKNSQLWQDYQVKKNHNPMLFPTEGAQVLGVSEFELLLSSPDSCYLGTDCRGMLQCLHKLGTVESIVRNEFAVHELQGRFVNLKLGEVMGIGIGNEEHPDALDLRFFMHRFCYMLAIENHERQSFSVAFFDDKGQAVLKVFLIDKSPLAIETYRALCAEFTLTSSEMVLNDTPAEILWQIKPFNDVELFHQQWLAMTDIHQFHGIVNEHALDRMSAYHYAPKGYAIPLQPVAIAHLFEAIQNKIAAMIFVGNCGAIQIHTAIYQQIKPMGDWLNIMDKKEGFTLHLNQAKLAYVWFVKRPNLDGYTNAIEAFDAYGNSIITLFGKRVEGVVQDPAWQTLSEQLVVDFGL